MAAIVAQPGMTHVTLAHMGGRSGGDQDGMALGAGWKRQAARLMSVDPQRGMKGGMTWHGLLLRDWSPLPLT